MSLLVAGFKIGMDGFEGKSESETTSNLFFLMWVGFWKETDGAERTKTVQRS